MTHYCKHWQLRWEASFNIACGNDRESIIKYRYNFWRDSSFGKFSLHTAADSYVSAHMWLAIHHLMLWLTWLLSTCLLPSVIPSSTMHHHHIIIIIIILWSASGRFKPHQLLLHFRCIIVSRLWHLLSRPVLLNASIDLSEWPLSFIVRALCLADPRYKEDGTKSRTTIWLWSFQVGTSSFVCIPLLPWCSSSFLFSLYTSGWHYPMANIFNQPCLAPNWTICSPVIKSKCMVSSRSR